MSNLASQGGTIKPMIEIRLGLYTQHGPCGHRLQRGEPLPIRSFDFPDTAEGRQEAAQAQRQLQGYINAFHGKGDHR